jgi:hypothetical protein
MPAVLGVLGGDVCRSLIGDGHVTLGLPAGPSEQPALIRKRFE